MCSAQGGKKAAVAEEEAADEDGRRPSCPAMKRIWRLANALVSSIACWCHPLSPHQRADEDDDLPLAAAAKKAAAPSDVELVMAVEEILAGEDVQRFNIKDLMQRLSAALQPSSQPLQLTTAGALIAPLCCLAVHMDSCSSSGLDCKMLKIEWGMCACRGEVRCGPCEAEARHQGMP